MKENSNGTDTNVGSMENSIEERIKEKYTRYSNGKTDTLELTIEDAIFILEKNERNYYVEELLQEAYKVILSDYKRVLKENEYMHNELDKQQTKINKYAKENEELKSNNEKYIIHLTDEQYKTVIENAQNDINQKLIQKVKDKIKELEEELEIMKVDNMYGRYKEYGGKTKWERLFATKYGMHDVLQELLEGRK